MPGDSGDSSKVPGWLGLLTQVWPLLLFGLVAVWTGGQIIQQVTQQLESYKDQLVSMNERQSKLESNLFERFQGIDALIRQRDDQVHDLQKQIGIYEERLKTNLEVLNQIYRLAESNRAIASKEHDQLRALMEKLHPGRGVER